MRPLRPADVMAAARALLSAPTAVRPELMRRMMVEADMADSYRRRLGRVHRIWGNGTLASAALVRPLAAWQKPDDSDLLECLALVTDALLVRDRIGHPLAQDMQRRTVGSSSRRAGAISSPQSAQ